MPRLTLHIEKINTAPANFPTNQLKDMFPRLEKYLKRDLGPTLKRDMEATTKNWSTPPEMVMEVTQPYGTRLQLTVQPKGRGSTNWKRVSSGTGPRTIRAKTPRGMAFQKNYTPKTTPGGRYGGSGRRSGPWRRHVMSVRHSTKPRNFSVKILKKRERKIHTGVQRIVRRG